MITRRSVLAVAVALGVPGRVFAQRATMTGDDVLRGRFVQERHLKGFSAPIRSEGSFLLAPARGLIWRGEKPFAVTTVVTSGGLLQVANGQELTRLPASRVPFLSRLFGILTAALAGDWAELDGLFAVARTPASRGELVTLTPRRSDDMAMSRIQSMVITVDRFVEIVEIRRDEGDFDRLTFLEQAVTSTPLVPDETALFAAAGS